MEVQGPSSKAGEVVAQAAEDLTFQVIQALSASYQVALHAGEPIRSTVTVDGLAAALGAEDRAPAAVVLIDPCHTLVMEDGGFLADTCREQHLKFIPRNYRRIARLFGALDAIHRLNKAGRSATQRELFYRATAEAPTLWRAQPDMDHAIRDVVGALRIGRLHMGVRTTEKGLIAGAITFQKPSEPSSSSNARHLVGASGVAITEAMLDGDGAEIDISSAHCILVVEKDSFFQHLLQGRLLATLPLVLVTGRGFPDLLTRRLLQRLQRIAPQLPQVYLGDYDPHGAAIFFKFLASCPWLRWLGMHAADVKNLPQEAALPLKSCDLTLQATLLQRPEVLGNEAYASEVRNMGQKFELEALHAAHGGERIAQHFVPEKILRRTWL